MLYNNAGQARQITNSRNQQTQLAYDYVERLQTVSYPTSGRASTTFSYNTVSTVHSVVDSVGTTTLTYAPNGWVLSVVYDYTASGLSALQELDYTYYPDGLCHTLTWKSSGTTVASWTYSYDAGGRLTGVSNGWNEATSWAYDGEGKLTSQSNANGTSLSATYNQARGWPTSVAYSNSAGVFASYGLTYDGGNNAVGLLTGVTEQDGSTVSYGYNALYRLTSDTRTGTNAGSHSYGYDLAGNATTVNGSAFAAYDNANKISSLNGGTISYDADGNLTSVAGTGIANSAFTWDERNRLQSATANGTTVNYGYGASGLRTWSQVGSGTKTFYLYAGTALIGEIPAGSSTPSAVYTWGVTGLISERLTAANKSLWYAFGPQGETRQLTDNTGAVVDTYAYSPYGVPIAGTGTDANPFRYGGQTGYYTDVNNPTGAILCGLRWYMPQLGRWISRDPIGYSGGYNLYEYCNSNPILGLDPLGLQGPPSLKHLSANDVQEWVYNGNTVLNTNPQLAKSVATSTVFTGTAAYSYLGGASTLGPIGVAAVAIPTLSYGAYNYIGVPLGNALFGPQTLGSLPGAPGYANLYARSKLRMRLSEKTCRTLQHEFKHASDFGVSGNWNGNNKVIFINALVKHVGTAPIMKSGTYRGTIPVTHFFNPANNLWVATDSTGNLVASWRLSPSQAGCLMSNGNVQ